MTTNKADALDYQQVFERTPEGRRVLQALELKFARNAYVRGGKSAERETLIRLGQQSVLNHIYSVIARANSGENEAQNDS